MIAPMIVAGAAGALVWAGGFLMGARRGDAARQALQDSEAEARAAEARALARAEAAVAHAAQLADRPAPASAALDEARLREVVQEALAPVVAQERLGTDLAALQAGDGRSDLNRLLEAIAHTAGLEAVLLSDASGLLLATSAHADRAEIRAGVSALLVTLAEQLVRTGEPAPLAFVIHDEAQRTAISRVFSVDGERFLLTAVAAGRSLAPTALDPVLRHIERLMDDWTNPERAMAAAG